MHGGCCYRRTQVHPRCGGERCRGDRGGTGRGLQRRPAGGHGDLSGVGASCTGISVGSILRLSCKEADDHWSDRNKRENHNDIYHTGCSAAGRAKGRADRNYRNGHRRDFYPCQEYDAGIL